MMAGSRESILPSGYISCTHSPGFSRFACRDCWMEAMTASAEGFIESVQSLEMSLRAMVAARESSGEVRVEVTSGVTWGGAGVHGQPVGEPADAVQRGGDHPCVVVEGDDGELGQEHGEQGLASSSSLSARDSATAYQAWRHASRGGQAAGR